MATTRVIYKSMVPRVRAASKCFFYLALQRISLWWRCSQSARHRVEIGPGITVIIMHDRVRAQTCLVFHEGRRDERQEGRINLRKASSQPGLPDKQTYLFLLSVVGALLVFYVVGYFLTSELYTGKLDETVFKVRLFRYEWQYVVWRPLADIERHLRSQTFDCQIRNGASLPPPAE